MKTKWNFLILTAFLVSLMLVTPIQAKLNRRDGVNYYKGTKETYYNLNMKRIYERADRNFGSHHKKWIREDGVKCYGPYVIVAAPLDIHPYGSIIETSLGEGIVLDTGAFAETNKDQIDIAVDW